MPPLNTHLMMKRITPQKHISTASTEKMLDSSATDTSIAVIVSRVSRDSHLRPPRPPRHRVIHRPYPHTCTHTRKRVTTDDATRDDNDEWCTVLPAPSSLILPLLFSGRYALGCQLSPVRSASPRYRSTLKQPDTLLTRDVVGDDNSSTRTCIARIRRFSARLARFARRSRRRRPT